MSKFNPKVSIIIPVYNGSNYLKEAIDSALAQTYKNIEIIVINDGSNDKGKTEKIAKSYGNKIRYFKKENGGVATALNLGIKKMTGEYFSWLSHDDLYYPDKIKKQIRFLEKLDNKEVVLYSNYDLINKDGLVTGKCRHDHDMLEKKPIYALLRGSVNGITILVSKSIFDDCGNFKESLRTTQDYDMWFRIMQKYKFVHMEDVLAKTRIHSEQDSASSRAVYEGNRLWIDMIKKTSSEEKRKTEESEYGFYLEMIRFLDNTPYKLAQKHCEKEIEKIIKKTKEGLEKYKVSVIIPFFNRIDLLENAIESVLIQTHKNIEIILVDDGSNDNYQNLKVKYKNNKKIVFYKLNKNKGASAARNVGIEKSKGDYIAFLDSDDLFLPTKITEQLAVMVASKINFSHTSYIRKSGKNKETIDTTWINGIVIPRIISRCTIATPTVMIKRSLAIKYKFDESFRIGEDVCFWLNILKIHKIVSIKNPLTIVNIFNTTTAFNAKKMQIGVQNILAFVINDHDLKVYNEEVYRLCKDYTILYEKSEAKSNYNENYTNYSAILNSTSWRITKPLRLAKLTFNTLKKDGAIPTSKKVINKITQKVKSKTIRK